MWGVGSNPEYLDTDHIWKYNAFNLSEIRIFYQIPPYLTIVYQILLYMFHISYHILPKLALGVSTYKTGWFWTRAHVGKYSSTMVRRVQILNGLVFQGKLKPENPIYNPYISWENRWAFRWRFSQPIHWNPGLSSTRSKGKVQADAVLFHSLADTAVVWPNWRLDLGARRWWNSLANFDPSKVTDEGYRTMVDLTREIEDYQLVHW